MATHPNSQSITTRQASLFEAKQIRLTKKRRLYELFLANPGYKFRSDALHSQFGTAARSRISDINNDPESAIVIRNQVTVQDGQEQSVYWSEVRR